MAAHSSRKTPPGRPWQKGQSGNPGGRPKGLASTFQKLAGKDGEKLAAMLWAVIEGDEEALGQLGYEAPSNRERLQAIEIFLDRGWGRAPQSVELTGAEGGPVVTRIERVIVPVSRG